MTVQIVNLSPRGGADEKVRITPAEDGRGVRMVHVDKDNQLIGRPMYFSASQTSLLIEALAPSAMAIHRVAIREITGG